MGPLRHRSLGRVDQQQLVGTDLDHDGANQVVGRNVWRNVDRSFRGRRQTGRRSRLHPILRPAFFLIVAGAGSLPGGIPGPRTFLPPRRRSRGGLRPHLLRQFFDGGNPRRLLRLDRDRGLLRPLVGTGRRGRAIPARTHQVPARTRARRTPPAWTPEVRDAPPHRRRRRVLARRWDPRAANLPATREENPWRVPPAPLLRRQNPRRLRRL